MNPKNENFIDYILGLVLVLIIIDMILINLL